MNPFRRAVDFVSYLAATTVVLAIYITIGYTIAVLRNRPYRFVR